MMRLQHTDQIPAPCEDVFLLVRDRMPELVEDLPNIQDIQCLSREEPDAKTVKIVNHWFANVDLPSLIKGFVPKEAFGWKDIATWDGPSRTVRYEVESFLGKDLFSAKGENFFRPESDKTMSLTVTCDVTIHADKLPGIPAFMAKKLVPMLESLLEKMLRPNLTSLGQGIQSYLKRQQKKKKQR